MNNVKFPDPPYRTMPGMSWDTDGEKIYVSLHGKLAMVMSVTEVLDIRKRMVVNDTGNTPTNE